jgi:MinD-like ATPase involved in chromosome partitioning or flagellar assembly
MAARNGVIPTHARGRIVVLVSGSDRDRVLPHLAGRRDLVLRSYTGPNDSRVPIESADVVLHVARADSPIANEVATVREQTRAPIVLALVGAREGLVDEALEASLADILILPQPPDVIAFSLRKAARERAGGQAKLSRVIMVSSTKGGTGKTSIAVNLAVGLAEVRLRTLLIDLDVQFGDVGIVLGLDRPTKTIYDLTASPGELDAERLRGYTLKHSSGLNILAAPLRPEVGENVDAARIAAVLQTARGMYDAIVVDTAPLFDGPMLTALDRSDQLLLVSTPDVPSMKNVRLALQTLEMLGFPLERVALVANRAGMAGGVSVAEVADTVGREVRFVIPEDSAVPESMNSGVPAVIFEPRGRFARGLKSVVGTLVGQGEAPFADEDVERQRERKIRIPGLSR